MNAISTFVLSFADVSKYGVFPSPKYAHHSWTRSGDTRRFRSLLVPSTMNGKFLSGSTTPDRRRLSRNSSLQPPRRSNVPGSVVSYKSKQASAPLKYAVLRALNRSCPGVSQSCTSTRVSKQLGLPQDVRWATYLHFHQAAPHQNVLVSCIHGNCRLVITTESMTHALVHQPSLAHTVGGRSQSKND